MIALVEGARRQKAPNEIALTVLLVAMTLVFLIVVASLVPIAGFLETLISVPVLVALLVCLIPTTIGGLLPAIGIAGMDRALRANVVAKSGKAVEVAGNIDTLLLDKTGTITIGDRQATETLTVGSASDDQLRDAAFMGSLADPTPEGQSTVALARDLGASEPPEEDGSAFIPFSAEARLSGVDTADGRRFRKGAPDAIRGFVQDNGGEYPEQTDQLIERVSRNGATPLVVAEDDRVLGVIALSDLSALVLILLCGGAYPAVTTLIGGSLFPEQATASLILRDGRPVGSALVGQPFVSEGCFHGRPSAAGYDPFGVVGSNMAPSNPSLRSRAREDAERIAARNDVGLGAIPVDMVAAPGSGIDPHITPAAAAMQVERVAGARGLAPERLRELVKRHTEAPVLGLLGEPRVHLLRLNLALDALESSAGEGEGAQ